MTGAEAGRALDHWGQRIQTLQARGLASRALDRLAATHDILDRLRHSVTATTPAPSVEKFLLRTSKFVDEATRFFAENEASGPEAR